MGVACRHARACRLHLAPFYSPAPPVTVVVILTAGCGPDSVVVMEAGTSVELSVVVTSRALISSTFVDVGEKAKDGDVVVELDNVPMLG